MKKLNCLIYCRCGAGIITDKKQKALAESFKHLPFDVFEVHDVCAFSLNEKDFLNSLNSIYDKITIVACYARAIENMFVQNGITLAKFEVLNFRELSTNEIIAKLSNESVNTDTKPKYEVLKTKLDVPAWYPIVEESRCTLCGQCARFCVFGVYKFNKKNLEVANPLACKNNCPACGRTCPSSAIIFPRLAENSVLSGLTPGHDEKIFSLDASEGLFEVLNKRNNARRNIFKQGLMQQAEEEKRKAIEELNKGLENN